MDFSFSPEEDAFRQEIRQFVKEELPSDWMPREEYTPEQFPFTKVIARKLGQRGWLALGWPKEYGGQGAPLTKQLVFHEEAAYWGIPGTGMGIGGTAWVGPSLILFGTEEQKKEHLPKIASGEEFWCTAYSEPGSGSDMASLICRAVAKGDGYVVEGQKTWTSAAHIADWCWLAARTDPQAPKHRGISLLIVDMKSPGITVRPLLNVAKEHHFNEVYFDGVMVPRKNLVGEENRGWYHIVVALNFERGWPGVRIGATAKRILDRLTDFIKEAKLNLKPALRHQLAEMAVQAEAARLLGYRVVHLISKGTVPTYESSLIKVYGTELIQKIASLAMKMVGLYGQLEPHSPLAPLGGWIERLYLLCLGDTIAAGTSEIQRNIIAQWGLGLPR